jgi:hypothetical protein
MAENCKVCPCCGLVLIPLTEVACEVCIDYLSEKDELLAVGENEEGKRYG